MSTRCQIGFYNEKQDITSTDEAVNQLLQPQALLYRHCDGYPGKLNGEKPEYGILHDIVPFLKLFHERRGLGDTEYASAWLLHHLIAKHVEQNKEYTTRWGGNSSFTPADGINCLGHGICKAFHWDIAYYYAIQGTKIRVYRTSFINWGGDDCVKLSAFKKIGRVIDIVKVEVKSLEEPAEQTAT